MSETFELVPFTEWRREIAVLWELDGGVPHIGPIINGHGMLQYAGRELFDQVLCFPWAASIGGERVAWTSTFNVSASAVRVRGIYVLPEHRGQGVGYRLVMHALAQWPAPWTEAFMYARTPNLPRYAKWGFEPVPGHQPRSWREGKDFGANEIVLVRKSLR
jgi:GNAT superfamily N-acetyltransferase